MPEGPKLCHNCGEPILVQCFLGEVYCSVNCQKALAINPTS